MKNHRIHLGSFSGSSSAAAPSHMATSSAPSSSKAPSSPASSSKTPSSPAASSSSSSSGSGYKPISGGASGDGTTTRYWDCCKASCSWPGKAPVTNPVGTCAKDGVKLVDVNVQVKRRKNAPLKVTRNNSPVYRAAATAVRATCVTTTSLGPLTTIFHTVSLLQASAESPRAISAAVATSWRSARARSRARRWSSRSPTLAATWATTTLTCRSPEAVSVSSTDAKLRYVLGRIKTWLAHF